MDYEEEVSLLGDLINIEIGRRERRPHCNRCLRPLVVCWCENISSKVATSCNVVILQHPHEGKRCLRTAPILQAALPEGHYIEARGKRFSSNRFPQLAEVLLSKYSLLMYPGEDAVDLELFPSVRTSLHPYNIIIIDGTWQQAKSMFHNSPELHALRQVYLRGKYISEYVIRTQPTADALSTVETAAIALASLEEDWSIYKALVNPLQLLCQHQMDHGAVSHQSKEKLILDGHYKKPIGKRTYQKLRKCGVNTAQFGQHVAATQIVACHKEEGVKTNVDGDFMSVLAGKSPLAVDSEKSNCDGMYPRVNTCREHAANDAYSVLWSNLQIPLCKCRLSIDRNIEISSSFEFKDDDADSSQKDDATRG